MNRLFLLPFLLIALNLTAQEVIPLYSEAIPNSTDYEMKEIVIENKDGFFGYRKVSVPTLKVYLPEAEKATGAAVIICPGGGYGMESYLMEGIRIAETFKAHGIAAMILKYRLPSDSIMPDKSIGPLQDAQQAIKIVRENADKWNISPDKIGIMGFSAGGHLASTAGTHFDKAYIPNPGNTSLRPDFMALVYPVISLTKELGHGGTRNNLLGEGCPDEKIAEFSNENHVNENTPPTWLTHSGDDSVVPVDNSIIFYQQLVKHNINAEMHLFPTGNHGFVLKHPTEEWMPSLIDWMKNSGFVGNN